MAECFKYKAFISYSHSDEKWASWLHKALETYRVPKHLVGEATDFGPVPERLAPVFRDREELPTATSLGDTLTQALKDSACQIVICSPRAARSRWTNEEILTFKRLGRSDRIFCLIVDGEPGASQDPATAEDECFPPALIYEMGDDGELTDVRSEPIAADARPGKDPKQAAKLKLIAGMLGVGYDSLKQREQQRRHRRMMALTAAAFAGMAVTSGLAITAYFARIEAEEQRNRAQVEAETARQTAQFMVDLFKVSDPSEALGNTITAREILDKGADRIDEDLAGQPEIQATLMDTMGTVYTSLALYPEAVRLIDRSLQKRRDLFGDDHAEVAQSLVHLGEVQTLNAEFATAEANLRDALEVRRNLFGDESAEVAESLTVLGDVIVRQGRFSEARPLYAKALTIRRALYEAPHPAIAESLEDVGLSNYDDGNYEGAVNYLEDALAMRRSLHGDLHPDLAQAIGNLAWASYDLGDLDRAEALTREGLAMKRKLLGETHDEIAAELNNLARIVEMQGDLGGAELLYREALDIYAQTFGEEHPDVALTMANLAFVVYASGQVDEAIRLARESYLMNRKLLGAEHPGTAGAATSLGFWLSEQGAYEEAETLLTESLAVRREIYGPDDPRTASTLTVLANLMLATGRFEDALAAARDAQMSLHKTVDEGHWRLAAADNVEGHALAGLGRYAEAESILLGSLDGLEQAPIPDLAEKGRQRMAEFYLAWGRPEQAANYAIE